MRTGRRKSPPIRFNDRQPDEWRMLCYTWRSLKLNETFFRPSCETLCDGGEEKI